MLYLLHPDEKDKAAGKRGNPGIRVVCHARGASFFFPGATPEAAMILAEAAMLDGALVHPSTEISFGLKDGPKWTLESVIKTVGVGG